MIGELPDKIMAALLETLPVEFSVLDKDDKLLAWNKHERRIFKRQESALGCDVHEWYPKADIDKVDQILREMKKGTRNYSKFWIDYIIGENKQKHKILIQYYALRDKDGRYLGCLEVTQDISIIQKIKGEKRMID
ncbi:MAG: PAS domain-containing protein [archaeon]